MVTPGTVVDVLVVVLVEVVEVVDDVLVAEGADVVVDTAVVEGPTEGGAVDAGGGGAGGRGAATSTVTVEEPWTRTPPTPCPQATTRSDVSPGAARPASQLRLKSARDLAGKVWESTMERPTSNSTRDTVSAAETVPRTATTPLTSSPARGETMSTDAGLTPGPEHAAVWAPAAGAGVTRVVPRTMRTTWSHDLARGLGTLVMASFRVRPRAAGVKMTGWAARDRTANDCGTDC